MTISYNWAILEVNSNFISLLNQSKVNNDLILENN